MKEYNRVYAKIDLDAAAYNMEQMKNRIGGGARLIAVVKTDAYGHGAVPLAEVFEKLDYVWGYAVATLDEGIVLRKHGIKKPILVLGCVFPDQYDDMVRNEIRAAVYMEEMAGKIAEAAERAGKKAYIHIKVDTGMGRIGFPVTEESADIIERISRMENIEVEGMFTHFAKADERDKTYTYEQHRKFMWMKEQMEKRNVEIPYYDCDNSAGIIDFPDMKHDLARAGISTRDFSEYSDYASFRDFVRNERGRELCFESLRKYDLIRWGIFVESMKGYITDSQSTDWTGNTSDVVRSMASSVQQRHIVLPIPTIELGVNEALVQNPLW